MFSDKISSSWRELMMEGWVHVTGLPATKFCPQKGFVTYTIYPDPNVQRDPNVMHIGHHNRTSVVYMHDSTVWIRRGGGVRVPDGIVIPVEEKSGKIFVPCSNGESLETDHLLLRVADPLWMGKMISNEEKTDAYWQFPATREELDRDPRFQLFVTKATNLG